MKTQNVGRVLILAVVFGGPAEAQDFGRFLERAAKETARDFLGRSLGQPVAGRPEPSHWGGGATGAPGRPAVSSPSPYGGFPPTFGATSTPESYAIKTADGWNLVARRYRPASAPPAGSLPLILCHGLTYNADFWDLDPASSPARYFAERGYDVWVVNLRGSGPSQKWVYKIDEAPEMLLGQALHRVSKGALGTQGYATIDPKYAEWNLDDHIAHDVPALVHLVKTHTRAAEVAWVGHSMGGIVALGHLARYRNPGIGRLVVVGSQVTMADGQVIGPFLAEMLDTRRLQLGGQLRGEALAQHTRTSVHNLFFNVRNVTPGVYEALGGPAMDIPSIGLLRQYLLLSSTGELHDARKQFNYARSMGRVTVPILIGSGSADVFAPPAVQKALYDRVGSADKTLVAFGRAQGFAADAGHNDALVGLNSRAQVYPTIDRWLRGERW